MQGSCDDRCSDRHRARRLTPVPRRRFSSCAGYRSDFPAWSPSMTSRSICGRAKSTCSSGRTAPGKSTLVKILSGIYQPDAGEILLDGKPVTLPDPHAAQQLGISTVHQELNLVPHLDVGRNMYLGREPLRGVGVIDWPALYRGAPGAARGARHVVRSAHAGAQPRRRAAADDGDRQGARRRSAGLDPR